MSYFLIILRIQIHWPQQWKLQATIALNQSLALFSVWRTMIRFREPSTDMVQILPELQGTAWNLELPCLAYPPGVPGPQSTPAVTLPVCSAGPVSFLDILVETLTRLSRSVLNCTMQPLTNLPQCPTATSLFSKLGTLF